MRFERKLEIEVETKTVKQAKKYGYKVFKLMFIGYRGAPDRLFGRDGDAVLIEFKRPGEEPGLQQLRRHDELRRDFGFRVAWTDSYAVACDILRIPED
jgi:hypothetical protein